MWALRPHAREALGRYRIPAGRNREIQEISVLVNHYSVIATFAVDEDQHRLQLPDLRNDPGPECLPYFTHGIIDRCLHQTTCRRDRPARARRNRSYA